MLYPFNYGGKSIFKKRTYQSKQPYQVCLAEQPMGAPESIPQETFWGEEKQMKQY
ncbi:MAG: hypothetical protein IKE65_01455 [Clostridia bacterium]|nr:hypothetical protein [Clostridia bacterium]